MKKFLAFLLASTSLTYASTPTIPIVSNNSELSSLSTIDAPNGLIRSGFLTSDDGPLVQFSTSTSACSITSFVGSGTITLNSDVLTVSVATSGKLRPGLTIVHPLLPAGTIISDYISGSGGVGTYRLSAFAPSSSPIAFTVLGDGGSQVPSRNGGCFNAALPNQVPIQVWGGFAGSNIDNAFDAAISYACASHAEIQFPLQSSQYKLAVAHVIGDGNATTLSTCNGVTLSGGQHYPENTGTTPAVKNQFLWTGAGGIIPITVQGPISAVNLLNLGVDCNNICSTGIKIDNALNSEYGWLGVVGNVGTAYIFTSTPVNTWGGGLENDWFHDIFASEPGAAGNGAIIGSTTCNPCTLAVFNTKFDRLHLLYDGNTATAYGLRLGFVNAVKFDNLQVQKWNTLGGAVGTSLQIAAPPGGLAFPDAININGVIADTDVDRALGGVWAPVYGGIHIDNWDTNYHAVPVATGTALANGYENIWGIANNGQAFGNGPFSWTPTDNSGAGLTLTDNGSKFLRLTKACAVSFDITYPATVDASVANIHGLPAACLPSDVNNTFATAGGNTNVGTQVNINCDNAGACLFSNNAASFYTNAGFSTKRITSAFTVQTVQ